VKRSYDYVSFEFDGIESSEWRCGSFLMTTKLEFEEKFEIDATFNWL